MGSWKWNRKDFSPAIFRFALGIDSVAEEDLSNLEGVYTHFESSSAAECNLLSKCLLN